MGQGSKRGPCVARLDICSDTLAVVQWVAGVWRVPNPDPLRATRMCQRMVADLRARGIRPATETSEFVRHVPREANTCVDAMSRGTCAHLASHGPLEHAQIYLRLMADGSHSSRGIGCGWVLRSATAPTDTGPGGFTEIAKAPWQLPQWLRLIDTELCALI